MNGGQLRAASIISLGLSCALDASTAAAQQPPTGPAIEEVVVTARRREENLQALRERLHAPLLATVPYQAAPDAEKIADLFDAARWTAQINSS